MNLGIDFAIYSLISLSALIPIYMFREKVFKFFYKSSDFETFLKELKKYILIERPYIKFDYSIVEKTSDEKNPKTRQTLIIENIIMQYAEYDLNISTQNSIEKDLLWQTYENDSFPKKDKLPKDWLRRKDLAWKRGKSKCSRCGLKIAMNDSQLYLIRDTKDGGTYHLENLISVCNDCNRILNAEELGKILKSLNITDTLMRKVTG